MKDKKNLNRGVFKIDENSGVPTQQVKNNNQQVKRNNPKKEDQTMKKDTNENNERNVWGMTFGSTDSL